MDSHTHYPEAGTGAYPNRPTTLTQRKSSRHLTPPRSPPNRTDFHDVGSPNTIRNAYPAPYYMQHHAGISAGSIEPKRGKGLRGHFVAATGEFVGTFMFLWFAFAGQLMVIEQASDTAVLNGKQSSQTIVFVSLIYGLSLLVNAWGWFRISGGLFNPAVTLGLCLSGGLPYLRGIILIPFQLLGAMAAAGLVGVMFPGSINDVQTTLATGTSKVQGVFIEMILTSLLVFMVLMLAAEKTKVTFLAPVGIGLTLFTAELAGVYYTGGSLNPARTLGPAVASRKFTDEHWVYWIGPLLGACLATAYYRLIKLLHYEEANPDQDSSGGEFFEK